MRFSRSWIINFGLIIIGIIFAFILIEVGLCFYYFHNLNYFSNVSLFAQSIQESLYQYDENLGSHLIPNDFFLNVNLPGRIIPIKINSMGLRDIEHDYEKKQNVFRILILGDSFMQADQVLLEKSFSRVLEEKLNSISGTIEKFEVINMGVDGYSTVQEYFYFIQEGIKYNPDLVILAFFPENDVGDNFLEIKNGKIVLKPYFDLADDGELVLRKIDEINNQENEIKNIHQEKPRNKKFLTEVFLAQIIRSRLSDNKTNDRIRNNFNFIEAFFGVYRVEYDSSMIRRWEVTKKTILKLEDEVNKGGASFLVFSIPPEWRVLEEVKRNKLRFGGEDNFDLDKPDNILSEFSAENNLNFLPLAPYFKERIKKQRKGRNYFFCKDDLHFNEKGHKLAAEVVADYLIKNNLVFLKK